MNVSFTNQVKNYHLLLITFLISQINFVNSLVWKECNTPANITDVETFRNKNSQFSDLLGSGCCGLLWINVTSANWKMALSLLPVSIKENTQQLICRCNNCSQEPGFKNQAFSGYVSFKLMKCKIF